MNLSSITADQTDGRAVLRLDGNHHSMDAFGDPTGMSTAMGFPTIPVRVIPLDVVDPSGAGRLVLRLEFELKNPGDRPGIYFGGDSYSTNALFHLVVDPASNGRHRLLIWDGGELKKQVALQDAHALRRKKIVSELQPVLPSERGALLVLQEEDRALHFKIEDGHVTGLFVTAQSSVRSIVQALGALNALKSFSLFDRLFSEEIAAALPRMPGLRELACNSCTVDEKVFVHIGKLKRLEVLSFGQSDRVSDFAMTWISQLTNLTSLTVTKDFYPRPENWRELVLSEQGIARVAALKQLTSLDFHGQDAGDRNAAVIAGLPRLERLMLSGGDFTDVGLAELRRLTNLTMLHLWDTGITEPAADAFKRPGLHFEPGPFGREHD